MRGVIVRINISIARRRVRTATVVVDRTCGAVVIVATLVVVATLVAAVVATGRVDADVVTDERGAEVCGAEDGGPDTALVATTPFGPIAVVPMGVPSSDDGASSTGTTVVARPPERLECSLVVAAIEDRETKIGLRTNAGWAGAVTWSGPKPPAPEPSWSSGPTPPPTKGPTSPPVRRCRPTTRPVAPSPPPLPAPPEPKTDRIATTCDGPTPVEPSVAGSPPTNPARRSLSANSRRTACKERTATRGRRVTWRAASPTANDVVAVPKTVPAIQVAAANDRPSTCTVLPCHARPRRGISLR